MCWYAASDLVSRDVSSLRSWRARSTRRGQHHGEAEDLVQGAGQQRAGEAGGTGKPAQELLVEVQRGHGEEAASSVSSMEN